MRPQIMDRQVDVAVASSFGAASDGKAMPYRSAPPYRRAGRRWLSQIVASRADRGFVELEVNEFHADQLEKAA